MYDSYANHKAYATYNFKNAYSVYHIETEGHHRHRSQSVTDTVKVVVSMIAYCPMMASCTESVTNDTKTTNVRRCFTTHRLYEQKLIQTKQNI